MTDQTAIPTGPDQSGAVDQAPPSVPVQQPTPASGGDGPRGPVRLPAGGGLARFVLMATSGLIAALTFGFSFGNVWSLDLMLGIEPHIAPLVGPAVDLSVIGLLITVQWLALAGATTHQLRPARSLLMACGVVTMALNSAPSLVKGLHTGDGYAYGRAAVEAIAPWLLIAWSHVGPQMLRLFVEIRTTHAAAAERAADRQPETTRTIEQTTPPQTAQDRADRPSPRPRTTPRKTTSPGRRLHAVQSDRMSLEDRVEVLDRTYPDRVPGRNEAMRDLEWSSASQTSEAVNELRSRRDRSDGPTATDDPGESPPLHREADLVGASA